MTSALRLSRQYVKLCDVADFGDAGLRSAAGEILGLDGPLGELPDRKEWERAMLATFLADTGHLTEQTDVLAIGAGSEPVLFWLANRVGSVVATDIYGDGKFAGMEADRSMLRNPGLHAPGPYREERLSVERMDARSLRFPDSTFDVVYSLSSIEHFGSPREIKRAAAEMGRVLKPGGVAFLATECLVHLSPKDRAPTEFVARLMTLGRKRATATLRRRIALGEAFTPGEIHRTIVKPSGLHLMQAMDLSLTNRCWDNLTRVLPGGRLEPATGHLHPHVLLQISRSIFTSICLALEKPVPG